MLAAMVAGDRTYLTHALRVGFERTGSFHMLVVSGFHLAIVAACILWIARRLRVPRVPATLLTIAASFAYALFTGFATPVQRSLWMVTLYLIGRLVYRERSALNTIGFAALCLLVVSPRSLFDSQPADDAAGGDRDCRSGCAAAAGDDSSLLRQRRAICGWLRSTSSSRRDWRSFA